MAVLYLDKEGSVLCEDCAEESRDHWIPHFRPESGPIHNSSHDETCDECGETIEGEQGARGDE